MVCKHRGRVRVPARGAGGTQRCPPALEGAWSAKRDRCQHRRAERRRQVVVLVVGRAGLSGASEQPASGLGWASALSDRAAAGLVAVVALCCRWWRQVASALAGVGAGRGAWRAIKRAGKAGVAALLVERGSVVAAAVLHPPPHGSEAGVVVFLGGGRSVLSVLSLAVCCAGTASPTYPRRRNLAPSRVVPREDVWIRRVGLVGGVGLSGCSRSSLSAAARCRVVAVRPLIGARDCLRRLRLACAYPSVLRALGEEQGTGRVARGWGAGCMPLTGTAAAVRRGGGMAVVLTAAAGSASCSAPRLRRRLRLNPMGMRGGRRRLVSLAWRVVALVCPRAGP